MHMHTHTHVHVHITQMLTYTVMYMYMLTFHVHEHVCCGYLNNERQLRQAHCKQYSRPRAHSLHKPQLTHNIWLGLDKVFGGTLISLRALTKPDPLK